MFQMWYNNQVEKTTQRGVTCNKVHLGFRNFRRVKVLNSHICGCGGIGRRASFRC